MKNPQAEAQDPRLNLRIILVWQIFFSNFLPCFSMRTNLLFHGGSWHLPSDYIHHNITHQKNGHCLHLFYWITLGQFIKSAGDLDLFDPKLSEGVYQAIFTDMMRIGNVYTDSSSKRVLIKRLKFSLFQLYVWVHGHVHVSFATECKDVSGLVADVRQNVFANNEDISNNK